MVWDDKCDKAVICYEDDGVFFCSVHLIIYQFLRHVQRYRGLSSSLYCLGPTEKWHWETLDSCRSFNRVFLYSCRKMKWCYREESTQAVHLLWILWSSIFVQFHHELLTAKKRPVHRFRRSAAVNIPGKRWRVWLVCMCCTVGPFRAVRVPRFLRAPDLFGLTSVVQREEDICILADAVVSEALQVDEEVVRHGDTAAITMALSRAVTLGTEKKVTASKTAPHTRSTCR